MKFCYLQWQRTDESESVSCSVVSDCLQPVSMELSRQEYWSGLPFPSPGGLPDAGIELKSPALQANSFCTTREVRTDEDIIFFSQGK